MRRPSAPDYTVDQKSAHELWLRQLDRVRDTLEQARVVIARNGCTSGAWFAVRVHAGDTRLVHAPEAVRFTHPRADVVNACLIGTLVRLAEDPDRVPTGHDVWGCVAELYEAMHEKMGHASWPGGRTSSLSERTAHLQALTAWNDAPGRSREQMLDLVDRAISRTIVAACRT